MKKLSSLPTEDYVPPSTTPFVLDIKSVQLHRISTRLHEISCKRELSFVEEEMYLLAQMALTPSVSRETMVKHLGRGGMTSFMRQSYYDQEAKAKLLKESE